MGQSKSLGLAVLLLSCGALAQQSYTTQRFWSTVKVQKNRHLQVHEEIDVTFLSARHGIKRLIPVSTQGREGVRHLRINVSGVTMDGSPCHYATTSGPDLEVKIGDASLTVNGPHKYGIDYEVDGDIKDFPTDTSGTGPHSELDWNILPTHWATSIDSGGFLVRFDGLECKRIRVVIGGASNSKKYDLNSDQLKDNYPDAIGLGDGGQMSNDGLKWKVNRPLALGEGARVVMAFPLGAFEAPPKDTDNGAYMQTNGSPSELNLPNNPVLGGFLGLFALPGLFLLGLRKRLRRPGAGKGVAFEPPAELDVLDAAYMIDASLKAHALVAVLISLGQKKLVKLHRGDKGEGFTIELLGPPPTMPGVPLMATIVKMFNSQDELPPNGQGIRPDQLLLSKLHEIGMMISPSMLSSGFGSTYRSVSLWVGKNLKHAHKIIALYRSPWPAKIFLGFILGVFAFVFSAAMMGWTASGFVALGAFACLVISLFATNNIDVNGERDYTQLMDLRRFILSATYHRESTHFAATDFNQALYDKLLPYAVLFDGVQEWTKAFQGIDLVQPDWYVGSSTGYWVGDFMQDTTNSTSNWATSPDWSTSSYGNSSTGWSSGDSGFSDSGGGGGSDGGGGGGGGDSW